MSLLTLCLATLAVASAQPAPETLWIEGESATAPPYFARNGWGMTDLLSGGAWLSVGVPEGELDAKVPGDAAEFSLRFSASGGSRRLWARLGFEQARSPFSWSLNGGDPRRVGPEVITTDLTMIDTWVEAAWLDLGDVTLKSGENVLSFWVHRSEDAQGRPQRLLFGLDAVALSSGQFRPNGGFKPGEARNHADDATARELVFPVPVPTSGDRAEVELEGMWEIARHDEDLPGPVAVPMPAPPSDLVWTGIPVPSDRNVSRPDLVFAHRLWYRTRIDVPASAIGRGFALEFPLNNLNTTVFVNGQFCGFNRNPYARWQVDVTPAIRPGVNEVWVGIRDAWYGFSASPTNPRKLRYAFNRPLSLTNQGFMDLAYPIWASFHSGILETPKLIVAGSAYVEDVFVKPSVSQGRLDAELTVRNPQVAPVKYRVRLEALSDGTDRHDWRAEFELDSLGAGQAKVVMVGAPWQSPTLWWPDRPHMYTLVTTLLAEDGSPIDVHRQPFGFREWGSQGTQFTLNGVRWTGWAELTPGTTPDEFVANYKRTDQRFMRLSGVSQNGGYRWRGLPKHEALALFDRSGVVVRRSGLLDGQVIGYMAIENDPELKALYGSDIKMELMENWREQIVAQFRGERNHPSIHVWGLENEWLYINCINLYGGLMDEFEREVVRASDAIRAMDPTRLTLVDGGGATVSQGLPIHGDHYVYTNNPSSYPALAFEPFPTGGGRGRWVWDQKRPRYLGEDFFASGINPADYAWIQGESAFQGKAAAELGYALVQRMLTEGYRWGGHYGAWHFWVGDEGKQYGKYIANRPIAAFLREYDWTLPAGESVSRTLGVFNDSFQPKTISWSLSGVGPDRSGTLALEPGTREVIPVSLDVPRASDRQELALEIRLSVDGEVVFEDRKDVSVLPEPAKLRGTVGVIDPQGELIRPLEAMGLDVAPAASLGAVGPEVEVLIVGRGVLSESEATSSGLAAWVASGKRAIVLEQSEPLRYQGLPAEMASTDRSGTIAFLEDPSHPVLQGLENKDLFTWPGDEGVYVQGYEKPQRGARSLVQAGSRLGLSALAEVPTGDGLLLLSQLRIAEKIEATPVARHLLRNLIAYAQDYELRYRPVSAYTEGDPTLAQVLEQIAVKQQKAGTAVQTIEQTGERIAIVAATPENLRALAQANERVQRFVESGGHLVLQGLTPEGLADFNRLVGVEHLIRPFRREKVSLATPRDPLLAGVSLGDVALLSSERMFGWNDDKWISSTTFGHIVDIADAAPFAELPSNELYNTVNGMVSADGWPYIYSFDLNQGEPKYTMRWPKPQTFTEIEWIGNGFYHLVTQFELVFDGGERQVFDVLPNTEPQVLPIQPARTASQVELRILKWQNTASASQNVVGIDNIRLRVARSPEFAERVRPMLNIGGLVRYPRGRGSIVLSNLAFLASEDVPENAAKKRNVLAGILRNLQAEFSGGAGVIAGELLDYIPVDLAGVANQYRTERGWFGDPARSFKDLPGGRQVMAGVPYTIYDFATSPVPTIVMLGAEGVPNGLPDQVTIPVGRRADALFFLMAARIDQPRNEQERREQRRFEMAQIEVTYTDGQAAVVPLVLEVDLDHYRQAEARSLPGSQVAWQRAWEGSDERAVAYSKQWNNPRPESEILSVTLRYGPDRRGVPALLALTAATRPTDR